jgi:hypothetical protein
MAVRPTQGGNFLLELNGKVAGALRSVQPPAIEFVRGATARTARNVAWGRFSARGDVARGDMMDWVRSILGSRAESAPLVDGALLYTDFNFQLRRRVDWTSGAITEIKFSDLDASSKAPFDVSIFWQPGSVKFAVGTGKAGSVTAVKSIVAANFRVVGLPFGASVVKVQLPVVTVQTKGGKSRLAYAGVTLGELRIEVVPGSKRELLDYIDRVIADGKLTSDEYQDISVEMLDPALKNVLATISLGSCGLLRVDLPKGENNTEALERYALTFSVEGFDVNLTATK